MRPILPLFTGFLLVGCGPVERPELTPGDPVENVIRVRFGSDEPGEARVVWTVDGEDHSAPAERVGPGVYEGVAWVPSGEGVAVRGRITDAAGEVLEGPSARIRLEQPPKSARWKVLRSEPGSQLGDGLILLNAYDDFDSYAMAIDAEGRIHWWVQPDREDQRILRVRPGLDGESVVFGRWARKHQKDPDDGFITRLSLAPEAARSDTRAVAFHHDWVEVAEGRFAWLSWVYRDAAFVSGLGAVPVAADAVRMADEGAVEGEETVLYDLLEDHPIPPFYSCGHMRPGGFVGGDWWEWSHSNSIDYDADEDAVRVLARYWDAVLQIGMDGELDWEIGGRNSDYQLEGWWHHAHASELAGDTMVVFDNGNHASENPVSAAVGIALDHEAGVAREAFRIPDERGAFTDFLGDVRTLPGGNLLVLYSPDGLIQERTPAGKIVWEAEINGRDMVVGRMTWTDQLRVAD